MRSYYKMLSLLLGLSSVCLAVAAQPQAALKVGDQLPTIVLAHVANTPGGTFATSEARGKVLVLEFWSTSCSPCIPALLRLNGLQQQHPAELQVVGIAPESVARLQKFLAQRPVALPLASAPGSEETINQLFPHRLVPHTVVIDRNGRIVAITSPEHVTEQALLAVANGQPVRLPLKQDVLTNDPMSFFAMDSATRYSVSVRPFIQGLPGLTRAWRQGPFAGRRLTAINLDLTSLFQYAYETSYFRVQNQLPDSLRRYDDLSRLCFDLLVPPGREADLRAIMRDELRHYVPVQATWVPIMQSVYVLRLAKGGRLLPTSSKPAAQSFSGSRFDMTGTKLDFLRDYLENELRKPVVDETGLAGHYDVAFQLAQENLYPSLITALAQLGLELVEAPRSIQLLRLSPVLVVGAPAASK